MKNEINSDDQKRRNLYRKISRRILVLLTIGYIVGYLDRVNVGFAKLQMLGELKFTDTVYGMGAGIFFVGYFLFEVPSNLLLRRVGARMWIARIMISWGIICAAMMFVATPTQFYVLRFLLGVAEAGFFPGVIYFLTTWYPSNRRAAVIAGLMTGVPVCSILGSALSGWIMQALDGSCGLRGWQWLFVLEGTPAVLIGIWVLFRLTDDLDSATWLTASEKQLVRAELQKDVGQSSVTSLTAAMRQSRLWCAALIYFALASGVYAISFWLPTLISEMGFKSVSQVGLLSAIPYIAAGATMVAIGLIADRGGSVRWRIALTALIGAAGLILSTKLTSSPYLCIAALSAAASGTLSAIPLFWRIPTAYLRETAAAGGIALINSFGNLAGFAGPYMIGWTKDLTGRTDAGLYVIASTMAVGALLVLIPMDAHSASMARSLDPQS